MRHRWIRLLAKCIAILSALSVALVSAQPALAWTHLINNYDTNTSDYTCGYSTSVPCLYWPEPNHVSSSIYAYIEPSLSNVGGYNFNSAITRAFGDFNGVPAFNPYMNVCNSTTTCGEAQVVYQTGSLGFGEYGFTTWATYGPITKASGQYYAINSDKTVTFSANITWNNTLYFDANNADGRKVATHETGHIQGLGHTGHTPAIMRQGATTYYALQTDDINGLESIYTGYIPV